MKDYFFDTPAFMSDFNDIAGQNQQWNDFISGTIDDSIAMEAQRLKDLPGAKVQFFNASKTSPSGPSFDQDIVWNAFPKTLAIGFRTKEEAYKHSEEVFSLTQPRPGIPINNMFAFVDPPGTKMWSNLYYRPLDEYCEWRVERNEKTGKIVKITFTSEPPEYWQALHGDKLQNGEGAFTYPFTGDKKLLLELYREYISKEVQLTDLECQEDYYYIQDKQKFLVFNKGDYNPYNIWNTQKGIMHLSHPSNYISAEIQLGADATVLRQKFGKPVTQADALICCAGYGGRNRTSDPTIGASVNDLARLGTWITLKNPIGLYMHDLNTQGFTKPNGDAIAPSEYFKVIRGDASKKMIERAVFEVPIKEGFTVGDIRIGGLPIKWGGQVTEHLNIKITGTAIAPGAFSNPMLACERRCSISETDPLALGEPGKITEQIPKGYMEVFQHEQGTFGGTREATETTVMAADFEAQTAPLVFILPHKKR